MTRGNRRINKRKIRIKNYKRFTLSMIVLVLIIFGFVKLFNSISKNKNSNSPSTVSESTNVVSDTETKVTDSSPEPKYKQHVSKAIPLAEGQTANNTSIAVLMYHYFYDDSTGATAPNSNYMPISSFEKQLKFLKENDYYYPTWDEVADYVDGKIDLPENSVVLTMDDGDPSVFSLALPLLEKYEVRATAFIITSAIDLNELAKYKDTILDLQSHTDNMHRAGGNIGHGGIFPALSLEEGIADLKTSIEKLDGNCGALAYPYGDCTERTKEAVKAAGFKVAFTTENRQIKPGMDKYELPRVRMFSDITLGGFEYSIT